MKYFFFSFAPLGARAKQWKALMKQYFPDKLRA